MVITEEWKLGMLNSNPVVLSVSLFSSLVLFVNNYEVLDMGNYLTFIE